MNIDFGCGKSKKKGFVGVDILPFEGVDVVHDLDTLPYPFEDNVADEIWMDNVLEHLKEPLKVVEKLHRIAKPNAKIIIAVPYFRSVYAFIDPTHRNFFGVFWFDYFDPTTYFHQRYAYSKATFKVEQKIFDNEWRNTRSPFIRYTKGIVKQAVLSLASKFPELYEYKLSHLFSLSSLTFHLKLLK